MRTVIPAVMLTLLALAGYGVAADPKEALAEDTNYPLPTQEVAAGKFEEWQREAAKKPSGVTYTRVECDKNAYWVVESSFGYGEPRSMIAVYAPTRDGAFRQCLLAGPIRVGRLAVGVDAKTGALELREAANKTNKGDVVLSCNLKEIGVITTGRIDDPADKAWVKKVAGVWELTAVETDGKSTAGDKVATDALKAYPTFLALGADGSYLRTHSNLAATESEKGTFSVVKEADAAVQVDVSFRLKVGGDLPKPVDTEVSGKELWRLTDADTLQRCYPSQSGKDRPAEFKTAKADGLVLVTYTRRKAPAAEKK